jgi:parvulin-like peptidyl-prolyl isomerase
MSAPEPQNTLERPAGVSGWLDFSATHAGRSFLLMGLGALIGISIAGFALFTAKGTTTFIVPSDAVALVNQRPIYRADWEAQLRTLYDVGSAEASKEQKAKVLEDMIREELFVQRGVELDVGSDDPDTRAALVSAVEQQVAFDAVSRQPTDEQMRAYYEKNRARYQTEGRMTVRDFLAPSASAAQNAVQAIRGGTPPATALARNGLRETKKTDGEEFYFAAKIHLGDALYEAATKLKAREISDPIAQPDGVHVLVMDAIVPPAPIAFELERQKIKSDMTAEAIATLTAGNEKFLRRRANVLVAEDMK